MASRNEALVYRVMAGEREAFGELVECYTGLVRGVIYHKVRRADEVDDLVQDVFCKAYQELPKLRDAAKFGPWLGRIALNRAQAWLRQYKVQTDYRREYVGGNEDGGARPDLLLENGETRGIVWEALDRLRPEYRQILLLFHFENCPQRDIARFLNISLPTVKWRLLRARQNLHRRLEDIMPTTEVGRERGRLQRQRVMAVLPLALWAKPADKTWSWASLAQLWQGSRLVPWSMALSLGVVGGLYYGEAVSEDGAPAQTALTVQLPANSGGELAAAEADLERIFPPCAHSLAH